MRRIISVISLVTASIFAMLFVSPTVYAADSSCDSYVFAIPAWYNGLMGRSSGSCQFEAEKMGGAEKDKPDVVRTAGKIGSNILIFIAQDPQRTLVMLKRQYRMHSLV